MTRQRWAQGKQLRRALWGHTYRERIRAGLESCRGCGTRDDLTFHHLVAFRRGGKMTFDNITILCQPCNGARGDDYNRDLRSLAAEEAAAPPQQRWAALAFIAAREAEAYAKAEQRENACGNPAGDYDAVRPGGKRGG